MIGFIVQRFMQTLLVICAVSLVVFVMIIVLSLFFWALDSLLGFITRWLAGGGG